MSKRSTKDKMIEGMAHWQRSQGHTPDIEGITRLVGDTLTRIDKRKSETRYKAQTATPTVESEAIEVRTVKKTVSAHKLSQRLNLMFNEPTFKARMTDIMVQKMALDRAEEEFNFPAEAIARKRAALNGRMEALLAESNEKWGHYLNSAFITGDLL